LFRREPFGVTRTTPRPAEPPELASGFRALFNNNGSNNVAFGTNALQANTNGGSNVATGIQALQANTTGGDNIATSFDALFSNSTGTTTSRRGPTR
jgi:trimeric autotransporter adhesin